VDVAVVTGAGRGMGREIALLLATRGYSVLATDVDAGAAADTAQLIGDSAWSSAQDVRDPNSHRAVAAAAAERGPIKVWVNNAGGGDIINMASMSSFGPAPGLGVYGATKHAVLGFSGSLQGDLSEEGIPIRVHAVCPDGVDTGMVRERLAEPDSAIILSAPRLLSADEVAKRAVALIGTNRMVEAIPRWRAWTVRLTAPFPRLNLRLAAFFRRIGERKRRKEAAA
jgi:NAD(P)-dependent dehydrogenase (short-subunit alcohol dehydrogenase family)